MQSMFNLVNVLSQNTSLSDKWQPYIPVQEADTINFGLCSHNPLTGIA